jgi:hypothetical protein
MRAWPSGLPATGRVPKSPWNCAYVACTLRREKNNTRNSVTPSTGKPTIRANVAGWRAFRARVTSANPSGTLATSASNSVAFSALIRGRLSMKYA